MKRRMVGCLLAAAFALCWAMAARTALTMRRGWAGATCALGSADRGQLALLEALYPDLGWTAYAQSPPKFMENADLPSRTGAAPVLCFVGAPGLIAPFPLIDGRLPLDGESACALDKGSAFSLFGSTRPGQAQLALDGAALRLVGVLDVDFPLALVPAGKGQLFTHLAAGDRDALTTLAQALGAAPDPFALSGGEAVQLARLLLAAPWALGAALVLTALRGRGTLWRIACTGLLWALALGALLFALGSVPVRLLPARWSDLAFYARQMAAWRARPLVLPGGRDVLLQGDMLRVALPSAAACIWLIVERKWLRCGKSR